MKNFDVERETRPTRPVEERMFQIAGETFVMRDRVRPEAYAPMDELKEAKLDRLNCSCGHPRVAHGPGGARNCQDPSCDCKAFTGVVLEPGSTMTDVLNAIDTTVLAMTETECHERYKVIRQREDDPLVIDDLHQVVEWMIEESTRRPTGPPSSSTGTPAPTGATSTDDSSSPDLQAA